MTSENVKIDYSWMLMYKAVKEVRHDVEEFGCVMTTRRMRTGKMGNFR